MAQASLAEQFDTYAQTSARLADDARACTLFRQAGLSDQAFIRLGELLQDRLAPQALIVVVEGTLEVVSNDLTQTLTAQDSYGAKYLLEAQPQQEILKVTPDTRLLTLDGPAYDQFAKEFPESAFALQAVLARQVLQELKKAQTNLRLLFETLKSVG